MGRIDGRLNSFVLAQKKAGFAKARPKVMATDKKRNVTEAFGEDGFYHNISPRQFKSLLQTKHPEMRWLIDKQDKLHACDTMVGVHPDIVRHGGLRSTNASIYDDMKCAGYARRNENGTIDYGNTHHNKRYHPMLDKFDEIGMKRSRVVFGNHFPKDSINEDEFSDIIGKQREKEGGFFAALRDPETKIIYKGKTHQHAFNSAPEAARKRMGQYIDGRTRNFSRASIAGFVNNEGDWHSRRDMEALTKSMMDGGSAEGLHRLGYIK